MYSRHYQLVEKKHNIATDYLLKVLGLNICADTAVGDDMNQGVPSGQRKRVSSGEIIVGPKKTLFMDEISTRLDSLTTFQIVKRMGNFVHQMDGRRSYMVYHGPRANVLDLLIDLLTCILGDKRKDVAPNHAASSGKIPPILAVLIFLDLQLYLL
uniref:Uncharacterized protein n=1 Tax=Chenopodium quinoa TaxID=63459 RepID=A0A803MYK9_CHEQI